MKIKRNISTAMGNWESVCLLCECMANSLSETDLGSGLAYIATDSLGGRSWKVGKGEEPRKTLPSHNGQYMGWSEDQLMEAKFTSSTSGAIIRIKKKKSGEWIFRFEGADVDSLKKESQYAHYFVWVGIKILFAQLPFEKEWNEVVEYTSKT